MVECAITTSQQRPNLIMNKIIAIVKVLSPALSVKELKHFRIMIEAIIAMTGRVTMLGISRWTEQGGSYRTVQRFFKGNYQWSMLRWLLIKQYLRSTLVGVWIVIGDEVVITKSGKETHGLGRFYSSIQNQPVSSLCFINISLLNVESRRSYPLVLEQLLRKKAKESAPKAASPKRKPGRPKGSKNKNHAEVKLSAFQLQLQGCIRQALKLTGNDIKLDYFVYDGALGHNGGLQMVKQTGLHLISKMRQDSSFYFPFNGQYSGKGQPRKYGDPLMIESLSDTYLCHERVNKGIKSHIYQVNVWHKKFPCLLNVVIIVKENLKTGKMAKAILFSDDLTLAYDSLMNYYQLRFQIEFNFRDAKQYWGLEDFMNIKKTQVSNAANFSLFMVTLSQLLLPQIESLKSKSILDFKTFFRARKYTLRIINSLNINPEEFLINEKIFRATEIGKIHANIM